MNPIEGIWADPAHDGCGLFIRKNGSVIGVGYFGHTLDGHNLHLTGHGEDPTQLTLYITKGAGVPSSGVTRDHVGRLSVMHNPDDTLSATLTLEMAKLAQVHVSPTPPAGHYAEYRLNCVRVL